MACYEEQAEMDKRNTGLDLIVIMITPWLLIVCGTHTHRSKRRRSAGQDVKVFPDGCKRPLELVRFAVSGGARSVHRVEESGVGSGD